ncbi:MAG: tetratricopeptide repeat protein [Hyphomicrobiaceae bacterium]
MGKVVGEGSIVRGVLRFSTTAGVVSAALLLGACAQTGEINLGLGNEQPKSVDIATASAGTGSQAELEKATAYWGEQHAKNPRDPKAAIAYARNLKAMGRKANALGALQATYMYASDDKELLSEYGRLALDLGQVSTAEQLLIRADDPAKPDWRIISARGTVLAKQTRFKEAIGYFEKALNLAPDQASVMNNLAMAYAMDGQAAQAETLLRKASASGASDPRIAKNLELVMGLQGKKPGGNEPAPAFAHASDPDTVTRAPLTTAAWNRPLPIEQAAAPVKVAAKGTSSAGMNADDIVRQAMEAEHAKTAKR